MLKNNDTYLKTRNYQRKNKESLNHLAATSSHYVLTSSTLYISSLILDCWYKATKIVINFHSTGLSDMSFTRIKLCSLAFGFIIEIKEDEKKISFCVVKINKIKAKRMKNMKQYPKIVHLRPKEGMQKFFIFVFSFPFVEFIYLFNNFKPCCLCWSSEWESFLMFSGTYVRHKIKTGFSLLIWIINYGYLTSHSTVTDIRHTNNIEWIWSSIRL